MAIMLVAAFFLLDREEGIASTEAISAKERRELVQMLASEFSPEELHPIFNDPRFQLNAAQITPSRPKEKHKNPVRPDSERGRKFWRKHQDILDSAEDRYGVPPQIVVSILMKETNFGIHLGRHRVINTLASFSLGEKKGMSRANGLRELKCFLKLSIQERWDPFEVVGSHAGAFSLPQFMPCSYLEFAVDGDDDGVANPGRSWDDAIMSVAHFLDRHGWKRDAPEEALYAYNRSKRYVRGVLGFAHEVRRNPAK